jgi:spermidine synthase
MKKRVCIAILATGFSGLVAQILLLRELLIVYSGNELSIGIILGNWLILEACGCFFLGRKAEKSKNKLGTFVAITVLFSLSLPVAILLTRNLKNMMGISIGESIGLLPMLYSSFLILLPASVLHGALFPFGCQVHSTFSAQDESSAGKVYVYETVGTIIGGLVCTYLLIPYLGTFPASSGLALLNFVVCLVLLAPYWKAGLSQKVILAILSVLVLASGCLLFAGQADRLHRDSVRAQWKNHNVVHYQNSQYGNICVVENQGQYIFFLDGVPDIIAPIPDMPFIEEFVHIPLLVHPAPARLLILSGGAGGVISEALKHPSVDAIDYAELDPLLLDLFRRFPTPLTESEMSDRRVTIEHIDGRLLLATTRDEYDLVLVGILEPSTLQTNRFFTREFFSLVKERLNEGGILVLGLPGSLTYVDEGLRDLNSCVFNTLKRVFSYVRAIPGDGRNLFLSSDSPGVLTIGRTQIVERLDRRNIRADVISPWHIEKRLHDGWQDWFSRFLEGSGQRFNSDFSPVGLFYSVSHWNALFAPSLRWLFRQLERINLATIVLCFAVLVLLYFLLRPKHSRFFRAAIPLAIMTTGFAGMVFELALILTFQSVYGHVFSWIGLLLAALMAGAACGAMLTAKVLARMRNCLRSFIGIELAIICCSAGWPFVFSAVHAYLDSPFEFLLFKMLFLASAFVCGLLIGSQFALANKMYLGNNTGISTTAGLLYASDLLGGWFGGIMGAVVLLPVLGLTGTCTVVGLLKLASFIVITTQPVRRLGGGEI